MRGEKMVYLKLCPRCSGDLFLDRDRHGAFMQCLQCGFIKDLAASEQVHSVLAGLVAQRKAA
ncbi:MAG: hypothetical protein HY686_01040 [Chloroflexi bacterium]|nr:hypothetical protein [Chloroflexota bacterium]